MRTQLLVAMAFLIGGQAARAQWPASANPYVPAGNAVTPWSPGMPPTVGPMGPVSGPVISGDPIGGGEYASRGGGGKAGLNDGVFWVRADGLVAWLPKITLPTPLVTTGSTTDAAPGALRQPGTGVLFGDKLDSNPLYGFQVEAGIFCDDEHVCSIDGKGFVLLESSTSFGAQSDAFGNPVIARPIYNAVSEMEGAFIDARPGFASGGVSVNANSKMWGFEGNARCHIGNHLLRGELLAGFRYLSLEENLTINDNLAPLRDNTLTFLGGTNFVNAPSSLTDQDQFTTRNMFYGGQVGGVLVWEDQWYFLRLSGKVGFGLTEQRVSINGSSTLVTPTGNTTVEGGILALKSNIGSYSRSVFGIVPEWGITGGVFVTDYLRVSAGYSFLLWNRVVRPGDAIDRSVNPSLVPTANSFGTMDTPNRPEFRFNDASFWVQAVQAGIEFVY